eukprot:5606542-Prymnesium_polylepis.1
MAGATGDPQTTKLYTPADSTFDMVANEMLAFFTMCRERPAVQPDDGISNVAPGAKTTWMGSRAHADTAFSAAA